MIIRDQKKGKGHQHEENTSEEEDNNFENQNKCRLAVKLQVMRHKLEKSAPQMLKMFARMLL